MVQCIMFTRDGDDAAGVMVRAFVAAPVAVSAWRAGIALGDPATVQEGGGRDQIFAKNFAA